MRMTWRALSLPVVLAAWLAAGPASADDPPKKDPPTLTDISVQLRAIEQSVADFDKLKAVPAAVDESKRTITQVKTDLDSLKADVTRLANTLDRIDKAVAKLDRMADDMRILKDNRESASFDAKVNVPALINDVRDLKKQLGNVQRDLDGARGQVPGSQRVSASLPAAPATGAIRLKNSWQEPVTILVNSQSYLLNPGDVVTIDKQPPGAFVYEVPRIGRKATVTLNPNETYAITVQPQ
jgi:archaellum component FlaC